MDEIERIFLDEAHRRLDEIARILSGPFPGPGTRELETLQRHAHSLKGTAGSLGQTRIESSARSIWTRLEAEARGHATPAQVEQPVREEFERIREEVEKIDAPAHS